MPRHGDDIQLDGIAGIIHRIVMLITFPFRHLLFFAVLAIVLLAVPFFYGVGLQDVPQWYKDKLMPTRAAAVAENAVFAVSEKKNWLQSTLHDLLPSVPKPVEKKGKIDAKKEVQFVSWNVAKFRHAKYENGKKVGTVTATEPSFSAIKKAAEVERVVQDAVAEDKKQDVTVYSGRPEDYYILRKGLPLEYLSRPERLEGSVSVVGANSLYVGEVFVYLYGIYSHPDIYDTAAAQLYLERLTAEKNVHCEVIAYTVQSMEATALCFVDGIFINKALVDRGLAKNVALR